MGSEGERLKKLRLEKGISLEEAHKKTKIHLNILKSIEGDSLSDINEVYLKGFLKIYCNFLGADPKDYIPDYKGKPTIIKDAQTAEYVLDKPAKSPSFFENATVRMSSFRPTKKVKTVFVLLLITMLLAIGLFNLGKIISSKRALVHSTKEKRAPLVVEKRQNAQIQKEQQQPKVTTVSPKIQLPKAPPQKETAALIKLIIRTRENCWVSVKADGRVVFQRVLEKGRFENWQAKDKIEVSLGNAGVVELEVNGQPFSNLGRRGQARKNIVITKEGLNIGR